MFLKAFEGVLNVFEYFVEVLKVLRGEFECSWKGFFEYFWKELKGFECFRKFMIMLKGESFE